MSSVIEVNTSSNPYVGSLQWGGFVWSDTGDAGDHVTIEYYIDNGPSTWTGTEVAGLQNALQSWADVANISFAQVFSASDADLIEQSLPDSSLPGLYGRHEVPEDAAFDGDAIGQYNYEAFGWDHDDPNGGLSIGGNGYWTLIHELGHALGLSHPHDDGGGSTIFPGVSNSSDTGTGGLNQGVWTVMSYLATQSPSSAHTEGPGEALFTYDGEEVPNWGYYGGPMAFDIAAIQALYGANTNHQGGNTTYTLPDSNGLGTYWSCIWDTGGTDRLIYGGTRDVTISLVAATLNGSETAAGVLCYADGIHGGYTIAKGVVIENAFAGGGDDEIEGNNAANSLYGRGGADVLSGLAGSDNLYGGLGADHHSGGGGAGIDYARYDDADYGNLVISLLNPGANTGAAAGDTYDGIEGIIGGVGADNITGNGARNYLYGGAGTDSIRGGGGNDYLVGGSGGDSLYGGHGGDEHVGGDGAGVDYARYDDANYGDLVIRLSGFGNTGVAAGDTYVGIEGIVGGAGDDDVTGNSARNFLLGGGGNDSIRGGGGNDSLNGGADADNLHGGLGADQHLGGTGFDYARYDDGTYGNLIINLGNSSLNAGGAAAGDTYVGIEGIVGGTANDTITGDNAANTLYGLAGTDRLDGRGGNDRLVGGTGARDDYRFSTALGPGNFDTITGFEHDLDKIVLSRAIFGDVGASLSASEFGTTGGANVFIIYNQTNGRLFYDEGGNDEGPGPILFATVGTGVTLDAGDFLTMA